MFTYQFEQASVDGWVTLWALPTHGVDCLFIGMYEPDDLKGMIQAHEAMSMVGRAGALALKRSPELARLPEVELAAKAALQQGIATVRLG